MNPNPLLLASVHRRVSFSGSKKETTGATVRMSLLAMKALSCIGDHKKSFFVLRSGRSGANDVAIELVHPDSWFAKPKKEHKSVWFVGVGNSEIASVIVWSTW